MPKHNLRKHNLRERDRDRDRDRQREREGGRNPGTGRYLSQCSCINHDEWSFNRIYTELNKKTIKKFGKDIVQRMWKDGTPPQFSKVLYTQCYAAYSGRCIFYPMKLFSRSFNYIA